MGECRSRPAGIAETGRVPGPGWGMTGASLAIAGLVATACVSAPDCEIVLSQRLAAEGLRDEAERIRSGVETAISVGGEGTPTSAYWAHVADSLNLRASRLDPADRAASERCASTESTRLGSRPQSP